MGHIVSNHERFQVEPMAYLLTMTIEPLDLTPILLPCFLSQLNKGILLQVTDTPGLLTRHDGESDFGSQTSLKRQCSVHV
jgi:hypothetical protein